MSLNIQESRGMSEKKLLNICKNSIFKNILFKFFPYWPPEIYSFGRYIRQYGYYPIFLPLTIYSDHAPELINNKPYTHELESDAPVMFYHSLHAVDVWKNFSKKPCYSLYSPFVFYRRKNNIKKLDNSNGTIAFYSHSTDVIDNILDPELYIKQLLELPEKFQPVSVCLYDNDVRKGIYKIFLKHNIPVYTAGNSKSKFFAERFYSILKNFSFATSNAIGSYLFYAVEMNIPFSIYGDGPIYINKGDKNIKFGKYDSYQEFPIYKEIYGLFKGLNTEITDEQKLIVEDGLGINTGVSRRKMAILLYGSFLKWFFSVRPWKWLYGIFLKIIKIIK